MNAERMHAVAIKLAGDLESTELPSLQSQLHTALTNAVNAPQDANQQNEVSRIRASVEAGSLVSVTGWILDG